ncbi:uncharacterized protein EI90DRAFT_2940427, partial [Cantharellus anzutake]|uniref:uncharacterized protein n=1 Tax=Cantharellus anzutake TaxID=1750568 RepID=UPI0019044795
EQLLMLLTGEGGTGKLQVIHSIWQYFKSCGMERQLALGTYTGIAASLIGGKMPHVLFRLMAQWSGKPGASKICKLASMWAGKEYLIIDEYSMISRSLMACLSTIMGLIKAHNGEEERSCECDNLRGLQFKPIVQKSSAALYWPILVAQNMGEDITGSELYQLFTTVVCLTQQMRVQDAEWTKFLQYARHGKCTTPHLKMLGRLLVTSRDCPPTNAREAPGRKPYW